MSWRYRTTAADGCGKILGYIIGMLLTCLIAGLIFSLPIMWLWNWLMPTIFGLTKITWLQSWGLMVLSSLLLKSTSTTKE